MHKDIINIHDKSLKLDRDNYQDFMRDKQVIDISRTNEPIYVIIKEMTKEGMLVERVGDYTGERELFIEYYGMKIRSPHLTHKQKFGRFILRNVELLFCIVFFTIYMLIIYLSKQ